MSVSRHLHFTRKQWSRLRAATPLTLSEDELAELRGINERVSLTEVAEVYLPLSRLLNLHVAAAQGLHGVLDHFLGRPAARAPYVLAVAGSVAVGKSTIARILQALLARWPNHPRVDLVTTDGFLLPNRILQARGLMARKGFPESYDVRRLIEFLAELKAGSAEVEAPVYSHLTYDVVAGEIQVVRQPDVLIVEGLNVLQTGSPSRVFVSDFVDFSLYVDAQEADIEAWYIERFLALREGRFTDPKSYFHRYAALSIDGARETAQAIWRDINQLNLRENIEPTRERAHLIIEKARDHSVTSVKLRKL